jgi:ornithine cyclodeaminase/alanine dehydrogenase-like protein (mu-crystallin family)
VARCGNYFQLHFERLFSKTIFSNEDCSMPQVAKINLTENDVLRLLRAPDLIVSIEKAFRYRFPRVTIAPRQHLQIAGGTFLIMTCFDPIQPALGIKLITVRDRAAAGEDRVHATYLLLDPSTGEPICSIAADHLTALRTAATSAVATKYLARENSSTLGIFGTGRLARAHVAVMPLVRNFKKILLCGREAQSSAKVASVMSSEFNGQVIATDPRTLARESDVICTCTTSRTPLFDGIDVQPGTHLNLVGAYEPNAREADSQTMQRARIFVDTYEGANAEAGDILIPIREGAIPGNHVLGDLHEVLTRKKQGRAAPEDITVFKSVGCALEDLAAAELLQSAMS